MRIYIGKRVLPVKWLKFIIGLSILALTIIFFSSGYSPPGVCGEVLRHNQSYSIDASPLFYSEVENMSELEQGIIDLRKCKKDCEDSNF